MFTGVISPCVRHTQEASMKQSRPRLPRWWMILTCVVASWLCWWGANKWLEPRALWSRTLPEGKYYYPLNESNDGRRLLAVEVRNTNTSGAFRTSGALVVIDTANGQELHRVQVKNADWFFDGEVQHLPRFHDDIVWFLCRDNIASGANHLCRWNLQTGKLEEDVKLWKFAPFQPMVSWPIGSKVLLVGYHLPPSLLSMFPYPDPFKALIVNGYYYSGLLHMPAWFESYQLPEQADQPLRLLARWIPPEGYWSTYPILSPDGKWAVFPEAWGDERLAYQRALATGRTQFRGQELFNFFRTKEQGLRAYDTADGRLSHRLHDPAASYYSSIWGGKYLITDSIHAEESTQLSLTELKEGAKDRNRNLFSRTFQHSCELYRVDDNGFHPIRLSWQFDPLPNNLYYHGASLNALQKLDQHDIYHELDVLNDELVIKRRLSHKRDEQTKSWYRWLPGTDQYISIKGSLYHRLHLQWDRKWDWLDRVIKWIDPYLSKEEQVVITEERGSQSRECSFQQTTFDDWTVQLTHLYLLQTDTIGDVSSTRTLNAYQVPLAIPSPWWCRGAACLPVALLLVMFAIRWKRIPRS